MGVFKSRTETWEYNHPSWEPSSVWVFKMFRVGADVQDAARDLSITRIEYDQDEERKARKRGQAYGGAITQESKRLGVIAYLVAQTVGWDGPDFTLPGDYERVPNSGKLDRYAGEIPPCTAEYVELMDFEILRDVEDALNEHYREVSRTPEQRERFPRIVPHPSRSENGRGGEETTPVPAGAE